MKNEKIINIKIIIDYQVKSFYELFEKCDCLESIYFKKFNRNNFKSMKRLFYNCSSVEEIDLCNFKTNNVTDMSEMFAIVHH